MGPIKKLNILTSEQSDTIFCNITDIFKVNKELLAMFDKALEDAGGAYDKMMVGEAFSAVVSGRVFRLFCCV